MSGAAPPATTAVPPACAWRSSSAWITLIVVFILAFGVDLWTKYATFANVGPAPVVIDRDRVLADDSYDPTRGIPPITLIPGDLLDLHLVMNRGAVFGIGQDKRFFFILFTVVSLIAGVLVFGFWTGPRQYVAHASIALILAGGVGNLYDRWTYGAVRDFLHMLPRRNLPFGWNWFGGSSEIFPWVFNLADVFLLTGMALLMIHIHRSDRQKAAAERAAKKGDSPAADAS